MDKDTFWDLVNPLQEPLFRFAFSMLKSKANAQDALQDVLEKLWLRKRHIRNESGNIMSFSMKIMKHHCIDILRKSKRLVELDSDEVTTTPHNNFEHQDLLKFIEGRISQLPLKQRMIIELKDFHGFGYEEISEVMDIPVANLRVYLGRARKFVLKGIEDEA